MLLDRACGSNLALTIESSSDNNNFIIVMHYSESCLHTEEGPKKKKHYRSTYSQRHGLSLSSEHDSVCETRRE